MRKEYDFSKADRGRFYRPAEQLEIPVYLDPDVARKLRRNRCPKFRDVSSLVNGILRKELELLDMLSG